MKRLESFILTVRGFSLFAGLYIEKYLEQTMFEEEFEAPLLLAVFAFLGLIAFVKIFEFFAESAIERCQWLRRIVLDDNYIEGVWFTRVPSIEPEPLIGLICIEIRDGLPRIEGEQYDKNGILTATWHSEMAQFDGSILNYVYQVVYAKNEQQHEIRGVSRISFGKASKSRIPVTFNGHFQDTAGNQKTITFTGFRVDKAHLHRLDTRSGKVDALKSLIAET